jgi:predicted ATPase
LLLGIHLSHFGVLYNTQFGLSVDDLKQQLAAGASYQELNGSIKPLTGLIGRNSTGKSALFEALNFISDCIQHGVPFAATRKQRGGFARLSTLGVHHEISFGLLMWYQRGECYLNYMLKLGSDDYHRPSVRSEHVVKIYPERGNVREQQLLALEQGKGRVYEDGMLVETEVSDLKFPALSVFGAIRKYPELSSLNWQLQRWYQCAPENRDPGFVSPESGGHRHLNENCDNIRNVLEYFKREHSDSYHTMIKKISKHIPDGKRIDDAFFDGEVTSGSLRLFTFLLLLEDPKPRPLICFEEPDSGLYHDMVDILAFEMRDYTIRNPGCQILFTTHNPYILESLKPDEVWVFERHSSYDGDHVTHGMTSARCIGDDPLISSMYKQGVGMGAMWYSGHFDQDRNNDDQGGMT